MLSKIKKFKTKQWIICTGTLMLCAGMLLTFFYFNSDSKRFKKLTGQLFVSELTNNTLSMHYTLAYPEKYGIDYKVSLPVYQAGEEGHSEDIKESLSALSGIKKENLSPSDSFTYDLLTRYLNRRLKSSGYSYYSEPFSPSSGMQSGLPILLADYTFRTEKDVEDYLDMIDQTDDYFNGLLLYEEEKSAQNMFMYESSAAEVIEQCGSIMNKSELDSGTHFLDTTFKERLNDLEEKGIITSEKKEYFISENDRLLTTVMQPAYEEIADAFTVMSGKGINDKGLYYFPQGKEYYENLLSSTTGSDRSLADIKKLLFQDFENSFNQFLDLVQKYPGLSTWSLENTVTFPFTEPEEMLKDLQGRMSQDFPGFPATEQNFRPVCTIKRVSDSMEEYSSPAYYLTPPIDDMQHNIIYINHKNAPDALTLYTTLAHEGYPGHLYQTVYSQLYMNQENFAGIRNLLHYGGFVEGWALYVENLSYEYAKALVQNEDPYAAAYYESCRLNRNLQLCLFSLLDIAIHHEGADEAQVAKILSSIGVTNPAVVKNIYRYIINEPATYPKYYLGFMEFLTLKKEAETLWGPDFNLNRFHKFILETGPCDFTGLKDQLLGN